MAYKDVTPPQGGKISIAAGRLSVPDNPVIPFIRGDWHSSNLHWTIGGPWGGWRIAFVWLFLNAWSAYGIEVAASFAPEPGRISSSSIPKKSRISSSRGL